MSRACILGMVLLVVVVVQTAVLADAAGKDAMTPIASVGQSAPTAEALPETSTAAPMNEKLWEIKFKAYAWITAYDGNVGTGNQVSGLDVNYCDVLHNLDLIDCMAPVNLEARYGRWGAYVDLFYVKLQDRVSGPLGSADLQSEQTILELAGFYRAATWPLEASGQRSVTLDILGGARYNRLEGSIGLQLPNSAIQIQGSQDWWDPFVGPRVTWQATQKLSLFGRGDVGGFGIENCSHFAWQIVAGLDYDLTKNVFLELGYRLLDTDFESGSGANHFVYDVTVSGPYLALGVKF